MFNKIMLFIASIVLFVFIAWTGSFNDVIKVAIATLLYGLSGYFIVRSNKRVKEWLILYIPNISVVSYIFYMKWTNQAVRFYENLPWLILVPCMIFFGCWMHQYVRKNKKRFVHFAFLMVLLPAITYFGMINYFNFLSASKPNQLFPDQVTLFHENGHKIDQTEWTGKVVLLEAWSRTCATCIEEMPKFNKVFRHYSNNPDVLIYSMYLPIRGDSDEIMHTWFEKLQFDFPFIYTSIDLRSFAKQLGITGVPVTFLIDKSGKIIYKGAFNSDKSDLVYNIYHLIDKQIQ